MEFTLNGVVRSLDAGTVLARVPASLAEPIRTHWVEVEGQRWPPKQAFRVATGITDEPFISHFALRLFQRLGFPTSPVPGPVDGPAHDADTGLPDDALDVSPVSFAFDRLDAFMASGSLTKNIAALEARLSDADAETAADVLATSGLDEDLVDSALIVREHVGMIDWI